MTAKRVHRALRIEELEARIAPAILTLTPGQKQPFLDADGSTVTVVLTGAGAGGEINTDDPSAFSISLWGTTEKSALTITVKGGTPGSCMGNLQINNADGGAGALAAFSAKGIRLSGDFTADGNIKSIVLGDIGNGELIHIEGTLGSLTAGVVGDSSLEVTGTLGTAKFKSWGAGHLEADAITSLQVTGDKKIGDAGDLGASLTVTGEGVAAGKLALGNLKIVGALRGEAAITGNAGVLTLGSLRAELDISGNAKSIKVNEPMAIVPPPGWEGGSLHVQGAATVKTKNDAIKFTDANLYPAPPELYRFEDLRRYDVRGAWWDYSGSYTLTFGGVYAQMYGYAKQTGTGDFTVRVQNYSENINGHDCTVVTASGEGEDVSTAWYTDSSGTHLAAWMTSDLLDIELSTSIISPEYMQLKKKFSDSDSFTATADVNLGGYSTTADITGVVKVSSQLLGHEQVSVPAGTYLAAKGKVNMTMSGKMVFTLEGDTYTAKFSVSQDQTWWAVPEVGGVKAVTTQTMSIGIAGYSGSMKMTATQELTNYG